MATAVVAGSTGLVGSNILNFLLAHPSFSNVYAYTRRDLPNPASSTKLKPLQSTDSSTWPNSFPSSATPKIFFSALGTTRAQAGGLQGQRAIDHDLAIALAKAAKDAGVETYVLVSAAGASSKSMFAYPKMKGELEDGVKALGFKHTIIVRPGFIAGERSNRDAGLAEVALRWIAKGAKSASPALANPWAQEGRDIARACVVAGMMCSEGKRKEGVWEMGAADIVALGKE